MPLRALAFALIAAIFHSGWNFILKKVEDRQVVSWWAIILGAAVALPLLLPDAEMPRKIWPYILSSALAETIYYIALMQAYANADFSLTYPIARGVAPALIAVWSMLLLGERPSLPGIAGLMIILFGLTVIGAGHLMFKRDQAPVHFKGVALALFIALLISVYSVIDATAVRVVSPLPYLMIVLGCTGLLMTPVVL